MNVTCIHARMHACTQTYRQKCAHACFTWVLDILNPKR